MNRASGDRVAIRRKIAVKYDTTAEREVIMWFEQLIGIKLEPGFHKLEKQLKSGQSLVKLAQKIQSDTPNCPEKAKDLVLKYSTNSMPFQQMANIQTFLLFCENYGVLKTGLFQTGDLFEGNNMQQVISCIQQLGSECQRNHFNGPCIGPKPLERNIREFTDKQLKAGQSIIGMQAGSSKGATQSGMSMGSARYIVDARTALKKTLQQGNQESEEINQESSESSSGDEESSDDE